MIAHDVDNVDTMALICQYDKYYLKNLTVEARVKTDYLETYTGVAVITSRYKGELRIDNVVARGHTYIQHAGSNTYDIRCFNIQEQASLLFEGPAIITAKNDYNSSGFTYVGIEGAGNSIILIYGGNESESAYTITANGPYTNVINLGKKAFMHMCYNGQTYPGRIVAGSNFSANNKYYLYQGSQLFTDGRGDGLIAGTGSYVESDTYSCFY